MKHNHSPLENSTGSAGEADVRAFDIDMAAVTEAKRAAVDVLMAELLTGEPTPVGTVTLERDGQRLAVIRTHACIEMFEAAE